MKKRNLLNLLSITTISMSLICTPIDIYAKHFNTSLLTAQITVEPVIVFKGKSVTCGRELDRDMALEYLNKAKTSVNFNDITVMVNIKDESSELIKGAILDLTKHDGETITLDYMYNGKILKTLKLNIECTVESIEFTEEANGGEITLRMISESNEALDIFKYINVEAVGGRENIDTKIFDELNKKQADKIPLNKIGAFTVTYSLKNDPTVTKELKVYVKGR